MTLPNIYKSYAAIAPEKYAGKLKGKVVVITGSSSGIGRVASKHLAAAGASVAAVARREAKLEELIDEIHSAGGKAVAIPIDIAAPGAAQQIISRAESAFGPVDVLINNAGITRVGPLLAETSDLGTWWRVFEVNVLAAVSLVRAVLPSMVERKAGTLITVSSAVATLPIPVMTAYTSSKAAITKFHESLVAELAGTGVLSFAVNPGMVGTELGSPEHAINWAEKDHPAMKALLDSFAEQGVHRQEPELPADSLVALAADPAYAVLTGRYLDFAKELTPVLEEAQKEGKGRIGREALNLVRIGSL